MGCLSLSRRCSRLDPLHCKRVLFGLAGLLLFYLMAMLDTLLPCRGLETQLGLDHALDLHPSNTVNLLIPRIQQIQIQSTILVNCPHGIRGHLQAEALLEDDRPNVLDMNVGKPGPDATKDDGG